MDKLVNSRPTPNVYSKVLFMAENYLAFDLHTNSGEMYRSWKYYFMIHFWDWNGTKL